MIGCTLTCVHIQAYTWSLAFIHMRTSHTTHIRLVRAPTQAKSLLCEHTIKGKCRGGRDTYARRAQFEHSLELGDCGKINPALVALADQTFQELVAGKVAVAEIKLYD